MVFSYVVVPKSFRPDIQKLRQMKNSARDIQYFLKGTELLVHRCEKCLNKGRLYWKIAKLLHLKNFGQAGNVWILPRSSADDLIVQISGYHFC
jgi:hypothetical protein